MRREHSMPEELIVQVDAHRHSYFLSLARPGLFEIADEEAITTLATTVRAATPRHKRWLGSAFELRLISAARYGGEADSTSCIGSIALGKRTQGGYAYLPTSSYFALPSIIDPGDCYLDLTFEPMKWGTACLLSIWLGKRCELLETLGSQIQQLVQDSRLYVEAREQA